MDLQSRVAEITSVGIIGVHREAQGASLSALPVGGLTRACFVFSHLPLDVCKHTLFHAVHSAPLAQSKELVGAPHNLLRMATPQRGDRILVFRPHWLNLILDDEKDLEIRGRNLASGPYWLGCRGTISGHCFLGSSILIDSSRHGEASAFGIALKRTSFRTTQPSASPSGNAIV